MAELAHKTRRDEECALLSVILEPTRIHEAEAAERLIEHFGSLRSAVFASQGEQYRAVGDRSIVHKLAALREALVACLREDLQSRPLIGTPLALLDYLKLSMGLERTEQVRAFFLNACNYLIREETLATGTVDQTMLYPREVITRALDLGASGLLLVHNHPSGDAQPSIADRQVTREIAHVAATLDVILHDHLIIAGDSVVSLRSLNII